MSGLISWLNSLGDGFVLFTIRMLIQSSVLILILLLLDFVLRRRVRAVVRYWIWLLVLAKLLLPPSLSSPTGLVSWIGGRLPEATIVSRVPAPATEVREAVPHAPPALMEMTPAPVGANDYSPLQGIARAPAPSAPPAASTQPVVLPTWRALVLLAWMAAVVIMVVLLIQRVFFVRALLAQSQEAPGALGDLLEQCRRDMGVHRVAGVRLTGLSASPSVCGLLRPVILMPEPMARQLDMPQLRSVLFHELAHIQRGDLWINLLQTLLQIVYLYHPLLWLANAHIRAIREQAVDEAVLAALGEEAEQYPRTLLSISKLAFGTPSLSLRLLGVVESKRALTARIRHMVSRPFPQNARLGLLGLAAVAIIAAVLLPMARAREGGAPAPSPGKTADAPAVVSADGVTVELLGLREYPGTGELWWRADGTPVDTEGFPAFKTTDPAYNDPKARVRVLAVRLAGPSLRDVTLNWSLTNAPESSFLPLYQDDQEKILDPVQTLVARFKNDAVTTDVKVGIAAGIWKGAAAASEGRVTASARDNITQSDVIYHPVQERDGSLVVTATHLLGWDYDCRIVAEDENHKVFEPARYSNEGDKMRLCTSVLNVPRSQVRWFRLQARPYEWVEVKDIRLIPESSALNRGEASSAPVAATQAPAGVVVDEQSKPVSGARVLLYFRNSNRGLGNKVVEETRTDAQGRFALTKPLTFKIDAGTTYTDHFLLFATHPDFALAWQVLTGSARKKECRLIMTPPEAQSFRVTDREGKPLPRARVWIRGAGRNDERNPLMRPSFAVTEDIGLLTATTDDQGRARITNLPRTDCSFSASLSGYSDRFRFASTPSSGEARIEMTRAGIATGQVLTKDGRPVAGAQVVFQADWGEWYLDYAVTDEMGRFRNDKIVARGGSWVSGGGTGQYKVTLRHREFAAPEVTVQFEPGRTEEFNIEAAPGTRLRVQVLEPETERPIAGARVVGSSLSGRHDGYTDANGVFERRVLNGDASAFFNSPPGGTYVTANRSGGVVRVTANGGVENITLYAPSRLHPLVAIKGRLQLPDGSPAAGVKISTANNMPGYETATWSGRGSAYARTNPDGSFELTEVPRDAEVFLYGETSDHGYILTEVLDPVQAGPELARPLVMREGRTASVILTDAAGKPRANMNLALRPRQWGEHIFRADDRSAATDAEGRLTLDGIIPGLEYFIRDARANLGESGWWNLYNENRVLLPADGGPATPDVQATHASPLPTAASTGGVIDGVVMDSRGAPIAGASVTIENKDLLLLPQPEKIGGQIRRVIRADSMQTDSEGRFRFTDLTPGKTGITVAAAGYRTEFALSTSTGTEDLRVVLGEPRPYRHSGVVADISCRPVNGVEVTFVEETLSGPGKAKDGPPVTVRTDERGQYRFDRLLSPVDRQSVRRFLYARKAGYGVWGCEPDTTGGQATGIIRLMAEERVSGVVKDETGAPIAGATVRLSAGWGYFGSIRFASTWQHLAPQTMTRADGSFTLGQLPTDSDLLLQVRAEGFASDGVWPVRTGQFGGYATRRGDTTSVMSTGGEPNTPLTITLQRAVAASKSDKPVLPPGATAGTKTEWPISAGGNGHFYQGVRMPKPLPWNEADGLAKLLGGHLVTITSAAENDFVFRLIDDDTYWYHSYNWRGPWIGAVQPPGSVEPADGWTWVTGEPFTYTRWDAGQPNNFNGSPENRAHFGNQRSRIPTWNDVRENFEEVVSFVVEWEPAQQPAWIEWPVAQGGNGHFYQVVRVTQGLTWDEANAAAQAQGGYLATITSAEENAFVFALIQDLACWNGPRGPWIGGFQTPGRPVREDWHWVTGEPFEYNHWSPGQPNDGGGADETRLEYGWGATTIADTWNDQPAGFRGVYAYVVEREPGGPTQAAAKLNAWVSLQVLEERVVVLDTLKPFSDYWPKKRHQVVGALSEKETLDYLRRRLQDKESLPIRIHVYFPPETRSAAEDLRQQIFALAREANAERDIDVRLEPSAYVGSGESPFYLREGKITTFYPHIMPRPDGGPKPITSGLVEPDDLEQHILWRLTMPKNLPLTFRIEYDEASSALAKQVADTAKAVAKRVGLTDLVGVTGALVEPVPESAFLGKWQTLGNGVIQSLDIQSAGVCQVTMGEGSEAIKPGTSVKGTWAWTVKEVLLDINDHIRGSSTMPSYVYRATVNGEGNLVIQRGEIWPQGSFMHPRPPEMVFKKVQ